MVWVPVWHDGQAEVGPLRFFLRIRWKLESKEAGFCPNSSALCTARTRQGETAPES